MDSSLAGSSVHGLLQARILEWVALSFSRGSSWPRDRTGLPTLQADSLQSEPLEALVELVTSSSWISSWKELFYGYSPSLMPFCFPIGTTFSKRGCFYSLELVNGGVFHQGREVRVQKFSKEHPFFFCFLFHYKCLKHTLPLQRPGQRPARWREARWGSAAGGTPVSGRTC